jgi:hypothetical protein
MKTKILLVAGFAAASMLLLCANQVVLGQNKKTTESNIATAAKTGRNCDDNKCSSVGGCASCVELLVSLPREAHVDDIQCMSNAGGQGGDYPHMDFHPYKCGADSWWSFFDAPVTTKTADNTVIKTTFHNRSDNRDRDAKLVVTWH